MADNNLQSFENIGIESNDAMSHESQIYLDSFLSASEGKHA
jgi:hypothetical protein